MEVVLHPYESIVMIHGTDLDGYERATQHASGSEIEINSEWTVSIAKAEQYPHFEEWGKKLTLSNMSEAGSLPRFTGTFRYETEFEWQDSDNQGLLLDLGEVYETAQVWINGEEAGVRICPPYSLAIDGLLQKGTNKLVIEVTNTMVKELPDFLSAFAQQEPSGLIGPVRVISNE
ncbi:Glycosyl hydrolases family 2, sugar binding domain [compost metagenome]